MKRWKVCTGCKKRKANTLENFHRYLRASDGLKSRCKTCCHEECKNWRENNRTRSKVWRENHRVQLNESRYKWRSKNSAKVLFEGARKRAKKSGMKMELTVDWVKRKLKIGVCEVTGVKLDLTVARNFGANPYRPSIDRKNNNLGYTKRNSRIVCWWYNLAKFCWTDELVSQMSKAVMQRR